MALDEAQRARLQELQGQIGGLKQLSKGKEAPEFKAWHAEVESVLETVFGETAPQFKKFIGIGYQSSALAATPSEKKVFYVRGLIQADAALRYVVAE